MNTDRKLTARQIAPENSDGGWGAFVDDDGRDWEIINWTRWGRHEVADIPLIHSAFEAACDSPSYDCDMGYWRDRYLYNVYGAVADYVRITGVRWPLPDWRSAMRSLHDYLRSCDYKVDTGRDEYADVVEFTCEILHAFTGVDWDASVIRGSSQGDYAQVIHPVGYARDFIEEVEARFFNEGEEWIIEDEDGDPVANCYTWKWNGRDEQLREQVCDQVSGEFSLTVERFTGYARVPQYETYVA